MIPRRMLRLSTAHRLLLAAWFGGLVLGELSDNFSQCRHFFHKTTPPRGISGPDYQPICQRYMNMYRFATLYHRLNRAPLYSAYQLKTAAGKRPKGLWKYEPQLASPQESSDMETIPTNPSQDVIESQAVLSDYANSGYTRGHLNPSMHQETQEDREATFTLTNIVPQQERSNMGPWSRLEMEVLEKFKNCCNGSMYVITGVMAYASQNRRISNRVSVPEYLWSAYCCPSFRRHLADCTNPYFPAYAAVGRNDPNSGSEIVPIDLNATTERGYDVKKMSVRALENILNTRLQSSVHLFSGKCQ